MKISDAKKLNQKALVTPTDLKAAATKDGGDWISARKVFGSNWR